ncbi:uncharacterized protein BT62DRAFT_629687 [Guyanagaster necrorhizus]|uniref:Protein kinase domain-containing protein n=1 Tax=Guyanagaster necrorhizus TaxID=856835 RepID=A0A9P7VGK7_9AGAR|nr:uncharacterized protein BT62DRAFT_629687 [Guyanagaster necrorhizus MCA 3950]KAG7440334.1 hypothetical protein BT62DRAFT_629687 [Guyanagaster necrorhizus MCA 3950]
MPTERAVYAVLIEDGYVKNGIIRVKIDDDKDMVDLLREIENQYNSIPTQDALIWLPNEFLFFGRSAPEALRARLADHKLSDVATPAEYEQTVESIVEMSRCQLDVQVKKTHIIIEIRRPPARARPILPEEAQLDDFIGVLAQKYKLVVAGARKCESPSVNAQSQSYNAYQGNKFPILDGRYNATAYGQTIAPPIELFHPVFAQFRANLADTEIVIPEDIVRDTASLMRSSSAIQVSEQPRTQQSWMLLSNILNQSFHQAVNFDRTLADHIYLCGDTTVDETAAVVIVEEKSELGAGGSEPSVQGSFSYLKFWADATHRQIREGCCCPSFIVGVAGPWLIVLGAVFTSQVIVQRLTDYLWLGNSRVGNDDHVLRIARILYALQGSVKELKTYYENLKSQPLKENKLHPRFFPSITSYRFNNKDVSFTYSSPLELAETCVTFLATLDGEGQKKVVVKFIQHYGAEAHKLLAELQLAPALLYVGPIDGCGVSYGKLQMVVMEYVQGQTLAHAYSDESLPGDVKMAVKKGVDALHNEDLVFGDLRRQNIMIADATGEESGGDRVRFIDFDWAGKAGDVRYPLHLASCIRDISGALEYDLIQKDHDIKMLHSL